MIGFRVLSSGFRVQGSVKKKQLGMGKILIAILLVTTSCAAADTESIVVIVRRNYRPIPGKENVTVAIEWSKLVKHLPQLRNGLPVVMDRNFGTDLSSRVVDVNSDKQPDYMVFDVALQSNEPVWSFLISVAKNRPLVLTENVIPDKRLEISLLEPFPLYAAKKGAGKNIASQIVESTLNLYPDPKDFPVYAPNRWNYEYSFFLLGAYKLGKKINNPAFVAYPKRWLDSFINEGGGFKDGVYDMKEYKLDDIIPARLAILFHQQTREAKYKSIVDTIATQLTRQPKTSEGGYWHKDVYPQQMWLDGIFMADVFSMQYAQAYNKREWFDEAVHQIKLIYKHTRDDTTGLLYHGWDESKNPVWAHREKGTSPEFWGRGIGWFAIALVECLDYLPEDHPERQHVIGIFKDVCSAVKKYQHTENNLWYQVVDKSNKPGNWPETSASAMFAYAFAKGFNQKYLDESFKVSAEKAYNAIVNKFLYADDRGNLHLDQTVKIGTLNPKTSKGDYQYYISTERRINDYKGLAAFLYASIELNK
jgi:unsaturated rhamnogalacturonyl hydrolase